MKKVIKSCPMCKAESEITIDTERFLQYSTGSSFVQQLFPDYDSFEREFLKSGYCPDCQELLFGNKYRGNRISALK